MTNMKNKIKNYGFVPSKISTDHYIMGSSPLPTDILQSDGNWLPFIPQYEGQADNFETYGCAVFGTENAYETLFKKIWNLDRNFSERFIYILSHIVPPGSDQHYIAETIRKNGLVNQEVLPMTRTLDEFKQPDPLTQDVLNFAKEFFSKYELGHEWVFTNNPNKEARIALLKQALMYSPVCVSVTAWAQDENGLYVDNNQPNGHWCLLVNLEEKDGVYYPVVFDTYQGNNPSGPSSYIKKLHPDHKILMAKRYTIKEKNQLTVEQTNYFLKVIQWIKEQLGIIQKQVDALPPSKPVDITSKPVVNTNILDWSTTVSSRRSCRIVMDRYNLTWNDKDLLCAVIQAESGFKIKPKPNSNTNGTTDYGIVQLNDKYWIGPGKLFENIEEVYTKPEKSIAFMVQSYKEGHLDRWSAYNNGSYKKYL